MEPSVTREKLVTSYWALLSHLDADIRVELITRLAHSLHKEATLPTEVPAWKRLYGAWESTQTPEAMIEDIRAARLFNRESPSF
jgi:hypothetical protein